MNHVLVSGADVQRGMSYIFMPEIPTLLLEFYLIVCKHEMEASKEEWVNPKYNWNAWIIEQHTILASVVLEVNPLFLEGIRLIWLFLDN